MAHQPAISFPISFQHPFNRAGGRTSDVLLEMMRAIAIKTTRHAEFFRRLFDRYAGSCSVEIDGSRYGPADIETLKATWCTKKKIRGTRNFRLCDGARFVASFDDSVDELFIAEEERDWIGALSEERLLRFRVLPVVESPSVVSRIRSWLGL